ncbi:DUF2188 domain-containing protein [Flavobacterium sp. MMS24-S5]|uniref:DUF2188 domain-containing protein n=1 Tax=Flavobacterium sp. MMS24-S5 TaxID=3416605 RepID=UPI003CFF18B2
MKRKSIYTKKLGQSVASKAHSLGIAKYHVISIDSNWSVVSEGNVRATRSFRTVEQAVDFAKEKASEKTGEVVVHANTGQIKDRISYSHNK